MSLERVEFKTEVTELLQLMIHSLYSHREIFLRELISNASDAIDRARYQALTDTDVLEGDQELKIRIVPNKEASTLTISDNGIGMNRETAVANLGTIAHSGTKDFISALKSKSASDAPELIGQFGVGFYSAFMVADKVTVITREAGKKGSPGVLWESTADGTYTIGDMEKSGKGTDVILHLKEDCKEFLDEWQIKDIVRKYSDFIEHPIVMSVTRETDQDGKKVSSTSDETLNSMKALWMRKRADVTEDEYTNFYRHVSHDFKDPLKIIHFQAEGTTEFSALLFIPSIAPLDIFYKDFKVGPMLYVRRVQIMAHCEELVPPYLRFIRGVIDSSDLPLNISREMLQKNRQAELIKKNLTKRVLDALIEMKQNEYEKYTGFFKELGRVLKEGIHYDFERRETVASLMLFESTTTEEGKFTTLDDYIGRMKEEQSDIYYINIPTRAEAMKSPYIESLIEQGKEVLFMTDEVDDFIFGGLGDYKAKKLRSVTKGEVSADKEQETKKEEAQKRYGGLLGLIGEALKDKVKEVRPSGRLRDSACVLVADEGDLDAQTEQILRSMGQALPPRKKILEINPSHPLIEAMNKLYETDPKNQVLDEYAGLLYDQALMLAGQRPEDPASFSRALARLMAQGIGQK